MRTLLKVQFAGIPANKAIKDGTLGRLLESIMADLKPESAYFFAADGRRTMQFVVQLKDPTDIPRIAERFFQDLEASVEMVPVMNFEDLKAGLNKLR